MSGIPSSTPPVSSFPRTPEPAVEAQGAGRSVAARVAAIRASIGEAPPPHRSVRMTRAELERRVAAHGIGEEPQTPDAPTPLVNPQ